LEEINMKTEMNYELVHELFNYDDTTGIFTNRITRGRRGKKGGTTMNLRNKTRLIGKVNGYWVTLDKRTKDIPEPGLVISGLAAVVLGVGVCVFCVLL